MASLLPPREHAELVIGDPVAKSLNDVITGADDDIEVAGEGIACANVWWAVVADDICACVDDDIIRRGEEE